MSDISGVAPSDAGQPVAVPAAPPVTVTDSSIPITTREAGRALAARRRELSAEAAPEAAADPPKIQEPDAQPEAADPVASDHAPDPADEPSVEPPRSWTKEAKERWQSLPRETQEYLATREQERDREVRRGQNEAAENRKAFEAERTAVTQARQQYEAALPALMQTLQSQQSGEFQDVQSMADVERLAAEDWPRFARFQAAQMKLQAVHAEVQASQSRQQEEYQHQWTAFASAQDKLFSERVPEFSDKAKASKLGDAAVNVLREVGFADRELAALWSGQSSVSLRDHRVQLLILDGVRYRDAQKAAKAAVVKSLPPVQRPGVAQPRGAASEASIKALSQKVDERGSIKDVAALIAARRRAAR